MNLQKTISALACFFSTLILLSCGTENSASNEPTITQQAKATTQQQGSLPKDSLDKTTNQQQRLLQQFDLATQTLFKNRSIAATLFGVSEDVAGYHFQSEMEDYNPKNEAAFRKQLSLISSSLKALPSDNKTDQVNREVVADIIDYYIGADDLPIGFIDSWMGHSAFVVNQINGPLIDIPNNLINSHTIRVLKDAEDYLQRLEKFSATINSINNKVLDDAKQGWVPPKIIVKKTIAYLDRFTETEPGKTSLVTSFANKLKKLKKLSEEKRTTMTNQAKQLVSNGIYEGYKKVSATMTSLLTQATNESGIWAQPKGEKFYQYAVSKLGDTDLTPDEIHQIGLQEVKRITAEMDAILVSEGYKKGSVGDRMTALNNEARFLYPDNDTGRKALLLYLNQTIEDIVKIMPSQFKSSPPYRVKVKRIPIATQDSSAGGYYTPPAINGSVPGIYWINLKNTKTNPKFDLKSLTYHEAVPGHHWQIALNLAQKNLPLLRRIAPYNTYVEGWALYSEQVAYEMGLYKDDPFGNLGRLKAELFRAVRLVVDTGMHAKKWSREQAISYMANTTGVDISDVISEIERYMVWPGQALGYKLGMLKILSLRDYAKSKLGIAFDIKNFHHQVLRSGAVPMKVLDENIKAWVETYL